MTRLIARAVLIRGGVGPLVMLAWISASAASFDCAKARSKSERLICGDSHLSAMDERLAALAAAGKKHAASPRHFQRELDLAWQVRQKCLDTACVEAWYQRRIAVLADPQAIPAEKADALLEAGPRVGATAAIATTARPPVAAPVAKAALAPAATRSTVPPPLASVAAAPPPPVRAMLPAAADAPATPPVAANPAQQPTAPPMKVGPFARQPQPRPRRNSRTCVLAPNCKSSAASLALMYPSLRMISFPATVPAAANVEQARLSPA